MKLRHLVLTASAALLSLGLSAAPQVGTAAPDFTVVDTKGNSHSLKDFAGKNVVLNIFPSIDTNVCATSTREFNKRVASMDDTVVLCIAKDLPFAQAQPGATALEMLLSATLKWAEQSGVPWMRALQVVTSAPAALLGAAGEGLGRLEVGSPADICIYDPAAQWQVTPDELLSQSKHTPFAFDMNGSHMPARVKTTLVGGKVAFQA